MSGFTHLYIHTQDRDKAEAALVEQSHQHQTADARTREMYEARLSDMHTEAAALRAKLDRLEAQGTKVGIGVYAWMVCLQNHLF